jgi:hypothetical protein
MSTVLRDTEVLRTYLDGIMERAEHHAGNVSGIALALVGAILWSKDEGTEIYVRDQGGDLKNLMWAVIAGTRYAFRYDHEYQRIEMREETIKGRMVQWFDNNTSLTALERFFRSIKENRLT